MMPIRVDYLNALTVDVEDYFQVTAFERDIDRKSWDTYPCRVVDNTRRLLEVLAEYGVSGTFFVVGWIAERQPKLVAEIRQAGHEVGSHSYWHRLVYRLTPDEFREDLRRSRSVLEDVLGEPIRVFRAPSFSITPRSRWALEILVEEGFAIDSSIFPIYHDRYGMPDADPAIHQLPTPAGWLWECPPSVVRVAGFNLPVSGGGYFRLYPGGLSLRWLRQVNRVAQRPFVFYVHPWEIDPLQPRLKAGSRISRWRHYVNLADTERKLRRLLGGFQFGTLSEVVARSGEVDVRPGMYRSTEPAVSEQQS
jgi:polysaccharide deacetylase family protein (PEP-CTERM system associated)